MRRLFVVSAGNVGHLDVEHVDRSETEPVHDPAQAWNVLTVGAFTEKVTLADPDLVGWRPVATSGDLSPYSATSVAFEEAWPIKPDVVFEGGNAIRSPGGDVMAGAADLSLLTTHFKSPRPLDPPRLLVQCWGTSAATAQVARMGAALSAEYPGLWPETIRALIVQSAEWTTKMRSQLQSADGKRGRAKRVRRYGFGVPDLDRALFSARNALTLVAQATVRPFDNGKMREMHVFDLPWPKVVLQSLGSTEVRLRITLSYFIEPNPGRLGWQRRHRYASHGLRFEVKSPTESLEEFRKRLNQRALDEDEGKPSNGHDSASWTLGEQARNHGSIHSDFLVDTAANVAERGVVGVYPVSGWWKDQPKRDRSEHGARYALVVSIETPGVDVDVWTPVAVQVGIPAETVIET